MLEWSGNMLKIRAKDVLRKRYWHILGTYILASIIILICSAFTAFVLKHSRTWTVIAANIIFNTFFSNVIWVGFARYIMQARQGKGSTLFWGFKEGRYMKIVKTMFLRGLYIFLWLLIFIIPGLVKSLQYFYVPYILADDPDFEVNHILTLSREMTNGEKVQIFFLNLSFLGWYSIALLSDWLASSYFGWSLILLLAGCIGMLFVVPYYRATIAELYAFVRERSIVNGILSPNELKDFNHGSEFCQDQQPGHNEHQYQNQQTYQNQQAYQDQSQQSNPYSHKHD